MQNNGLFGVYEIGEVLGGVFHVAYDPRVAKGVGGGFVLDYDNLGQGISFLPPLTVFQSGFVAHPQSVKVAPRRFGAVRGNVEGIAVDAPKGDARDIRDAFGGSAVYGAGFEREGRRADGEMDGNPPIPSPPAGDRSYKDDKNYALHNWMIT